MGNLDLSGLSRYRIWGWTRLHPFLVDVMSAILTILFLLYIVSVTAFLVLDNRSPQSTFAWLFLFIILPVIGLLIYVLFGRSHKAFSRESDLVKQEIGHELTEALEPLLSRQDEYIEKISREKPASYKKKLLHLMAHNSSSILTGYNELEILQNASQKYPRLLADLKTAQASIHMEYYIWTDDQFTRQVKEVLMERARAGVEVRCLYDASGGKLSTAYLQDLWAAGVQIHPYLQYLSPFKLHNINYRSHRKIVVIDGKIGYVGGLNLDKDQLDGGRYFDCWRDTHLRLRGEAALALQSIFVVSWYNTTTEKVIGATYFPPIDPEITTFVPVQITTAGPDSKWGAIRQLYFYMILAAEEKVYIQSPFFIPDTSISEALKAAALAGVEVKMIFTPRGTTYTIPYWAANTYFQEMAEAGVRIFLYQKGYFHPKTINIDTAICSVGTANMDIRSFSINYEVNAVIYDADKAGQLEQDFLNDLKYCLEFDLQEYENRNIFLRLRDSLCRLASPLL